ncbi:glycoside hydrolase family 127 protein [Microlunatus panaciterrae]|uniref:DUF1680 family protein n=1 Tax=Microlunatus panaciterrae TaxID=400768 RepID=A0ABS2RNS1_9ACTN|nr:beta-L-arabinofuranosidase domain-containing protein [Microlunatus panaciterrae]MBM7800661.1 DUF1680 family protein [Microlunatus panaciterrae]
MTHRNTAVVDTTSSPHALLRPVGVDSVRVRDDFWSPRLDANRGRSIAFAHDKCSSTGALDNFRRAAGELDGPFQARYYSDSDVYKWVESASWALAAGDDEDIRRRLDETIELIAAAQDDDGYLNTYFSVDRVDERWTDLVNKHEMYCLGHLVQAAVAHFRATSERRLLDVALRCCALVESRYSPDRTLAACGHPNLEMALVELYRLTGEQRWLRLAEWQLDSRGHGVLNGSEYLLDHQPVRQQSRVTGHAVRALYLYAAMADVVLETGDPELTRRLEELWTDLSTSKISVTGGVGARWDGEAFGESYELSDRPYNETCAAIAEIYLAWRLLLRTGDGRYREAIEWALYNAVLPGLSLEGTDFFYQNPLADAGRHRRQPWFDCACCPPNITRLLGSLPGYALTTSDEGLWLHQLLGIDADIDLPDGTRAQLSTTSGLPYRGTFTVRLGLSAPSSFVLRLPAPSWAAEIRLTINGVESAARPAAGYLVLEREWADGDELSIDYDFPVRLLAAHPYLASAHHRVAITQGPLVYCLEQADHVEDIRDLSLTGTEQWKRAPGPDLPGVEGLSTTASARTPSDLALYRPWQPGPDETRPADAAALTAIPYFAWANREPGLMTVMIPLT